tara:strand:- start:508 stop:906 length:399 start_codon:yes stop_codon:yes gene_type:complete
MAMTTPKKTVKQPNIDNKVILSFKKNIFKITVKGAAKENNILFLLGPIFCKATNSKVSPKKIPIIPDKIILNKYSLLIVSQELIKVAYKINTIDTKKSLNRLKAIPPILLVMSADIKDEIDQQKAARIAKTK